MTGYIDWVMDSIGESLIGSYGMVTEALRRRRVEADASDRFVERILGLELDAEQYDAARPSPAVSSSAPAPKDSGAFFDDLAHLPTPNEVDARAFGWPGSIYRAESSVSSGRSGGRGASPIGSTSTPSTDEMIGSALPHQYAKSAVPAGASG